jgi:MerR family transcriptional regulator, light-induced transcriptional regulator
VFAELRRERPDLPVHHISRRTMLAISRAIEDEAAAAGGSAMLAAGFQTEHRYRQSEPRWRELARISAAALVFAEFGPGARATGPPGPHEVTLPPDAALQREWFVACYGPRCAALLAGWELLAAGHPAGRSFEATWTAEPAVVARSMAVAVRHARAYAPALDLPDPKPSPLGADAGAALRRTTALANRIVSYLDRSPMRNAATPRRVPTRDRRSAPSSRLADHHRGFTVDVQRALLSNEARELTGARSRPAGRSALPASPG